MTIIITSFSAPEHTEAMLISMLLQYMSILKGSTAVSWILHDGSAHTARTGVVTAAVRWMPYSILTCSMLIVTARVRHICSVLATTGCRPYACMSWQQLAGRLLELPACLRRV